MLTTAQIEAGRELARIGFTFSEMIDGIDIGYVNSADATVYRSGDHEQRADVAFNALISGLPSDPLGRVIGNAAEEIVSRVGGPETRISSAAVFQSSYTLALACGLDPNKV